MSSVIEWPYLFKRLPDLLESVLLREFGVGWLLLKTKFQMTLQQARLKPYLLFRSARSKGLICHYWFDLLTRYAWLRAFEKYPETLDLAQPEPWKTLEMSLCDETTASGFYATERHQGRNFRWSHSEAVVRVSIPRANYSVEVQLVAGIVEPANLQISACFDGKRLAPQVMHYCSIRFYLKQDDFTDDLEHTFSLACRPTHFPGDSRKLGLPIASIRFDNIESSLSENGQLLHDEPLPVA